MRRLGCERALGCPQASADSLKGSLPQWSKRSNLRFQIEKGRLVMSKASAWRMGRRDFLQTSALAALALSGAARTATAEDRAATHNMLVFGDQTVFFSHLPM